MNMAASRFKNGDLRSCILDRTDLRGSNFTQARLSGAKLRGARFEPLLVGKDRLLKTEFTGANLRYTDFTGANLRDADFAGADLSYANFSGSDLEGAGFRESILEETKIDMGKIDVSHAIIKKPNMGE